MENDWEVLIAIVGLWIPITITLVNIAGKFGRLVNSVEQMQQQLVTEKAVLDDLVIRVTKLEVMIDGKIKES
tara:strand:- start:610 stop:825 length:216 start_codon:yes stop_codon:yes gene_type:complete